MVNFVRQFFSGISAIRRKSGTYRKISIDELTTQFVDRNLDFVDLSELDLSNYGDFFMSHPTGPFSHTGVYGWTENVIWPAPNKMPNGFDPQKYIETKQQPIEIDALQKNDITGRGINIAIIDSMFNKDHQEYADNIKYFQGPLIKMSKDAPKTEFHGSMTVGCAVGKKTGVAPDATIYYFTRAKNNQDKGRETIAVLKSVLEFNKKQSPKNKIHILSCSWAPKRITTNDKEYQQVINLFNEIESNGVKIIFCGGDKAKNSFAVSKVDFVPTSADTVSGEYIGAIQIPTNEKTVPYHTGGYLYQKIGGDSSSAPYLAGVYACALQGNQIFMTRKNWQEELNTLLRETAIESEHGGKMINPMGIREHVSQIAREMELQIAKQNGTQYE